MSRAIPLGRYSPAAMPVMKMPVRIMARLLLKPVMIKTIPVMIADRPMVFYAAIFLRQIPSI